MFLQFDHSCLWILCDDIHKLLNCNASISFSFIYSNCGTASVICGSCPVHPQYIGNTVRYRWKVLDPTQPNSVAFDSLRVIHVPGGSSWPTRFRLWRRLIWSKGHFLEIFVPVHVPKALETTIRVYVGLQRITCSTCRMTFPDSTNLQISMLRRAAV